MGRKVQLVARLGMVAMAMLIGFTYVTRTQSWGLFKVNQMGYLSRELVFYQSAPNAFPGRVGGWDPYT